MDEPALVRRLTTIVSVDVVGFSTMSARDEEHALDLLGARMATAETTGEASSRPRLQADRRRLPGGVREPGRGGARRPRDPGGDALGQRDGRPGQPAHPAHRHQSRRHRGKRRRPDGRCRQRRGAAGIDRAARRHLRLGLDLRADRRQAHAGRRGHGRAARQEHPAPHPCLSAHAGGGSADRHRRRLHRRRASDRRASRIAAGAVAVVAIVAIARRLAAARTAGSRRRPSVQAAQRRLRPQRSPRHAVAAADARSRKQRRPLRRRPPPPSRPGSMSAADVPFVPDWRRRRARVLRAVPRAPRRWRSTCAASSPSRRAASTIRPPAASPSRNATRSCGARCRSCASSTAA